MRLLSALLPAAAMSNVAQSTATHSSATTTSTVLSRCEVIVSDEYCCLVTDDTTCGEQVEPLPFHKQVPFRFISFHFL
ncbi:hypothetical protein HD806DRAFT_418344 [Xylariaceae sp. AK1471]|nr:hypothetical protein HD806DRAFT_418344 [Xylariaceae sp. AK1471]